MMWGGKENHPSYALVNTLIHQQAGCADHQLGGETQGFVDILQSLLASGMGRVVLQESSPHLRTPVGI